MRGVEQFLNTVFYYAGTIGLMIFGIPAAIGAGILVGKGIVSLVEKALGRSL